MLIRDANIDDTAAILRLLKQVAASSDDPAYGAGSSDEQLLKVIENCRTLVLEIDGRLVGINAVRIVSLPEHAQLHYRKMGFVMALGIEEAERRKGHGSALFDHMRKWLLEEAVDLVSLSVAASNEVGQAFYRRMGFVPRSVQMEQLLQR